MTRSETSISVVQMKLVDFDAAEVIIERGQRTFVEVGEALMAIRDGRGYRHAGYPTFEAYVRERWGWSRKHGYALIRATEAVLDVTTWLHPNTTQSQAIEVARIPREDRSSVLESLPKPITEYSTRELRQAIAERRLERAADSQPKSIPISGSVDVDLGPALRFCQDLPSATIVTLILRVAFSDAETALDATYGNGAFWDGSAHVQVTGIDLNPTRAPNGAADFRDLPYEDEEFDVVLFDPPHLADAGTDSVMGERFGTFANGDIQDAIRAGSAEAMRVARLGCVIKVTDHIHGQQFVRETGWVITELGEPYDVVHQVRSGALVDPKWETQLSFHNNGSTYLIFRKDGPVHKRRAV